MMWKLSIFALLVISWVQQAAAICNQCKNGHACVSETEFQLCFNNELDPRGVTYSCPDAEHICTQYGAICMPKDTGAFPACRGRQNCECDNVGDYNFACTSRNTFRMCFGGNYTGTRGTCRQNQMCDVQLGRSGEIPCTNKCIDEALDSSICDFNTPVDEEPVPTPTPTEPGSTLTPSTPTPSTPTPSTPTPSTPTPSTPTPSTPTSPTTSPPIITPTPPINEANTVCASKNVPGRYAYPNDTVCRNYVYCFWENNVLQGKDTICPNNRYFNSATRNCQVARPTGCA